MAGEAWVGLMSGTSMDGIDAVLVRFDGDRPHILASRLFPWPAATCERLRRAASGEPLAAGELAALDSEAGEVLAQAALAVMADSPLPVRAIGSHGQTLAHAPDAEHPATLQIGNPALIAERTGVTTVADFRHRDIAAGGQGAPLVPAFHAALFRTPEEDRAVLNLGGIANLTLLPASPEIPVSGFDTGPANCLLDLWARRHLGQDHDADGALAARGRVLLELLQRLREDPYFAAVPPKSTGTDHFSGEWLAQRLAGIEAPPEDVQATLVALTAETVAEALRSTLPAARRLLVCGGGVHNPVLMQALEKRLPCPLQSTAAQGLDPDWVEATAFAWLARRTLQGLPGNLPTVTGAAGPRVLGAVYPA